MGDFKNAWFSDDDSDLNSNQHSSYKEQETPLHCWGRLGFKMPPISEIYIPCNLLQKKKTSPSVITNLVMHTLNDSDDEKQTLGFSTYQLLNDSRSSEGSAFVSEMQNNTENTEHRNCAKQNEENDSEVEGTETTSCIELKESDKDIENNLNFDLFDTALPRKFHTKNSELETGIQKMKNKKKKNQTKNPPSLSKFFKEQKDPLNPSKSRGYTLKLDMRTANRRDCDQSVQFPNSDCREEPEACGFTYTAPCSLEEAVEIDVYYSAADEFPDLPSSKAKDQHRMPSPVLPQPLTIKSVADSLQDAYSGASCIESPQECVVPLVEENMDLPEIVIENVPKDTDQEELEHLLKSYGEIENLQYVDVGDRFTLTLNINSDPEWIIDCLNDSYAFGDFPDLLKVYCRQKA